MGILNIKQRQKETKYENKIKKTKKGFLFFNIQGQRNSKAISFWKWNKNENIFCLAGKKLFWMCKLKTLLLFWRRNKQMEENIQQIFLFTFFMLDEFLFCTITQMIILFRKRNQIRWNLHFPIWRTHISTWLGGFTIENLEELEDYFITKKIQFLD